MTVHDVRVRHLGPRAGAPYSLGMTQITRRFALAAGAAFLASPAFAAPSAQLISGPWQSFGSASDPDHGPWAAFLDRYVVAGSTSKVAKVRYGQAVRDGARLTGYLDSLQAVDPTSLSRKAAMAYWLNFYNALTVDLVLEAFPVDSIKKVRGGLFNTGPWGEKVVTVAGRTLSLDDIEHGILRPVWKDPRIHYGVNCASLGCPDLDTAPFTAANVEGRLDALAQRYVAHSRGARATSKGAVLSSIYDWFVEDFGGTDTGALAHVNSYRSEAVPGPVRDHEYDWSLNAA